ncbi:low temperature requirement protein A [Nocardioides sp.]|uniref:low temperature requirement protein A n=1 Tax=Nocardioides sp. TaxID=35761 RepID=UPI003527A5DF
MDQVSVDHHHLRPMSGRDPREPHRAATPLELLFDLTLVVAFGVAGEQLAHSLAVGHVAVGLAAFGFVLFGATWAWISYTRFATAYDTDDWFVRLAVLVQMLGVLVFTLGIPDLFHGFEHHWEMRNETIVAGYVVMRVALVALWLRAARDHPERRHACRVQAGAVALAQVGWVAVAVADLATGPTLVLGMLLFALEVALPMLIERTYGEHPWHPHHLAERYGLLTIIALGEGVIGTTASLEALYQHGGWSVGLVAIGAAGVSLTVGLWWVYFSFPFAQILELRPASVYAFAYAHLLVWAAVAMVGAGLHVAAYYLEHEATIGRAATVLTIALPVALFVLVAYVGGTLMTPGGTVDPFHVVLVVLTALVLGGAVVLAMAGASLALCLVVVMLAPWVTVVGFELLGHRHMNERLAVGD